MNTNIILSGLLILTLSACASSKPVPPEVSGSPEHGFSANSGSGVNWQDEERVPASKPVKPKKKIKSKATK